MRIYVSYQYSRDPDSKEHIERAITDMACNDKSNVYISPVHCFGYIFRDPRVGTKREIEMCISLLGMCEKMIILGEALKNDDQRIAEIQYCKAHGIPYETYNGMSMRMRSMTEKANLWVERHRKDAHRGQMGDR